MQVKVIDHPLIQHKLTHIRDVTTGTKEFRELLDEIAMLMTYELTRNLNLEEVEIQTPVAKCKAKVLAGKKMGVIPILRAGLGMVNGVLKIIPAARVGHRHRLPGAAALRQGFSPSWPEGLQGREPERCRTSPA